MERTDVSDLRRSDWSFGPGDELRDARNWRSESGGGYDFVWGFLIVRAGKGVLAYPEAREIALHREWMIRGFATGLAVAAIRPIIGFFFATSPLTGLTPHEFFGTAFWIGFVLSLMAAEAWIHVTATQRYGMATASRATQD